MPTKKTTRGKATAATPKSAKPTPRTSKRTTTKETVDEAAPPKPEIDKTPSDTQLSAIDAAAKVLATTKEPMNATQMIEAMAAKKLWTSPGGKTPHATLYSAILREIKSKGKDARFKKTERGKFVANG